MPCEGQLVRVRALFERPRPRMSSLVGVCAWLHTGARETNAPSLLAPARARKKKPKSRLARSIEIRLHVDRSQGLVAEQRHFRASSNRQPHGRSASWPHSIGRMASMEEPPSEPIACGSLGRCLCLLPFGIET